jgi:hypothetical protein
VSVSLIRIQEAYMHPKMRSPLTWFFLLASIACTSFRVANAQSPGGNNAVYNSSGQCCQRSPAFIDASVFNAGSDLCVQIFNALSSIRNNPNTAVIDARGILTPASCALGETPWFIGSQVSPPATILLPAGVITIETGWILPDRTRLLGDGNNPGNGTIIQADSSYDTTSGAMLQMGSTALCFGNSDGACHGIGIQDLEVNGIDKAIVGIQNNYSGELSYVNHVNLHDLWDTGLIVSGPLAQHSGPYSNIAFSSFNTSGETPTMTCINLKTSNTRGTAGAARLPTNSVDYSSASLSSRGALYTSSLPSSPL